MEIVEYTEKSFVVCGNTKEYKEELKELGGKWNLNLKVGPGWIFSNNNRDKVTTWISNINNIKNITNSAKNISTTLSSSSTFSSVKVNPISLKIIEEYIDRLSKSELIKKNYHYLHDSDRVLGYKKLFFNLMVERKEQMSFQDYESLNIDKIIEYSVIEYFKRKDKETSSSPTSPTLNDE